MNTRLRAEAFSRRSVLRGMTGAAALLAGGQTLAACGKESGGGGSSGKVITYTDQASGTVRYLSWEGFAEESYLKGLDDIKISSTYFGSFDEMFGKLQAGGGASYDAVNTASDVIQPLAEAGLLAPIDVSTIPNYENLFPAMQSSDLWNYDGQQYAVPLDWGSTVLMVNDKTMGQMEQTLPFETLFDPELKGRVTAMDDLSVIYTTAVFMGYNEYWALDDEKLAEIQTFLVEKLLPNVRKFSVTFADQATLFANGEVDLAWGWTGVILATLAASGVDYVSEHQITPAMPWYVDTISAVAENKNPEGVAAWINHNLEPEIAAARFEYLGLPAIVPDAADHLTPEQQQVSHLGPGGDEFWSNLDPALQWNPVERRDLYQEVWNAAKSGIKEFAG